MKLGEAFGDLIGSANRMFVSHLLLNPNLLEALPLAAPGTGAGQLPDVT